MTTRSAVRTFGGEEEYVLLDPARLSPVDLGVEAVAELQTHAGGVVREFYPSQVEFASPVFEDADQALSTLTSFRTALGRWGDQHGVIAASTGTPLRSEPLPGWEGRYACIADDIGALAVDHQINGLHVHVGIDDRDERVRASNSLRPWLPVLLALSANSPFWHGSDTGFASWRGVHSRRWTTYGIPPWFANAAAYDDAVRSLRGIGVTSDLGTINWAVRLSSRYPTVEVRVCDAQLDPRRAVAIAVLIRALVNDGAEDPLALPQAFEPWDAALWHAARYGLAATLVHPSRADLEPARQILGDLRRRVLPRLSGMEGRIVAELLDEPSTGADLQRRSHARGRLGELYRSRLTHHRGLPPAD